ncbi:MAG: hypothetical protein C0497_05020 [Gemmatimonas sp.]|nr:hypothetical protein [Gemmatimonas sp.]
MMARASRFRIPPPSDWILFGRPAGEWVFLAVMSLVGVNELWSLFGRGTVAAIRQSVAVGRFTMGVTAIGVVVSTIIGWRNGLRFLWLFAAAACITAPLAAREFDDTPPSDLVMAALAALVISVPVLWYGRRRMHAAITQRLWSAMLAEHAAAADEFAATIGALTAEQWTARRDPEAWSPAEITDHLARTYSQYAGEARGKNSLRIRLRFPMLVLARAFVKPRLLRGAPFPKAKAPRPLRPGAGPETPADGIALFRATGTACLCDLGLLAERRPYRQLVHPYLGALPLYDMVRFAAQHVRHHHRQVLAAIAAPPSKEASNVIAS